MVATLILSRPQRLWAGCVAGKSPSARTSLAAEVNLRLYRLTGREEVRQSAQQTLEALVPYYADLGFEAARFALAVDRFLRRPLLVTVVGENEDPARAELLRAARRAYAPNKTVQAVDPDLGASPPGPAWAILPSQPRPPTSAWARSAPAPPPIPKNFWPRPRQCSARSARGRAKAGVKGYTVDEGFKPEPGDRFQYFFRVLKGDERVFRYCIWTSKEAISARWPDLDLDTEAGRAGLEARLRAEGRERIQAKIDDGAFENWLLDLRGDGEEEVILEERDD